MVTIAGWQESSLTVELERRRKLNPLPALNELQVRVKKKKRKLLTLNQLLLFYFFLLIRTTEQAKTSLSHTSGNSTSVRFVGDI